jgi:hypothetical protein
MALEQIANFFHIKSTGAQSQLPTTSPSYRGTGAPAARRNTLAKNGSIEWNLSRANSIVANRGLSNQPGQNNCFLNAAIQILWHTDSFRRSFRLFEGHFCIGSTCIFCALKVLFTQYQYGESASIPPDVVRRAMATCYKDQYQFQLGLMDDAAECFEKLLEQLHYRLTGTINMDTCSTPWCITHTKFALTAVEQTYCKCQSMEPSTFVEFVHYVSASFIKLVDMKQSFRII